MRHLIPYFIQNQYEKAAKQGQLQAYVMFIDLSGFTPLTETLMKRGNEGAEQLSISLNNIFAPMVNLVYQKKGFIPYFAGDAFSAIFSIDQMDITPLSFLETAEQLLELFTKEEIKKTNFGDFHIGIKIGLTYGSVEWGIVGERNKSFYFRGPAINDSARCEMVAKEADIIIDENLKQKFGANLPKIEVVETGLYRIIEKDIFKKNKNIPTNVPELNVVTLKNFLPDAVINFNQVGEFRSVVSIFISFKGIDSHELLDEFTSIILEEINNFSGYFKEVDFGDKGGVMLGFFGAPISFENNIDRALEFAATIQEDLLPLQEKSALKYRIGITSGVAYTGIVGGEERCQYAVVGNRVNIAARLMINAKWGEVLVDEEIQKSRLFKFEHTGDIRYKGIENDIPTYRLLYKINEDKPFFAGKMVGREAELKELKSTILTTFEKQTLAIAYIYGEAGIGKSRLSFELHNDLNNSIKLNWLTCQADQILKKSFNPFIYFLKNYFKQSPEHSAEKNKQLFNQRFEKLLEEWLDLPEDKADSLRKELIRTKSILAALLGIIIPDSLWEQLDAKGRFQNTLAALSTLFITEASIQPIVIELEDGHWFDENSIDFLKDFTRKVKQYPIFILITSRYKDDGTKPYLLEKSFIEENTITVLEKDLNILQPAALKIFAESQLGGKIDTEFLELLLRTTNGNPFYAEQILEYFSESNLLDHSNGVWHIKDKNIKLSSSINAILTARVDRLSSLVKETVKAAAVIGREFEIPILSEVMKRQEEFVNRNGDAQHVLKEQVKKAERGQIWRAMNELRYIFKHSLLRETVYDMQLRTRLRELHYSIAEAIERLYADHLDPRYVDLAFHYEQADAEDKTNEYLEKAADYSKRNYQNEQALAYYTKLIARLKESNDLVNYAKSLLKKGDVLEMVGRWDDCEAVFKEALEVSFQTNDKLLVGRAHNNLGYLFTLKGNYEEAKKLLEIAASYFEDLKDTLGIFKVYGNLGNLYFRQGKYDEAKDYFSRSIEQSRNYDQTAMNAQIVANLGLTHMNQGNYDAGIKCQLDQLEICQKVNDKKGMATLYTNVGIVYSEKGDYDEALVAYEKGLALSEELGNKLLMSIAIGCIGSVYQRKGNFQKALENYIKDLEICEELGDKQGISIVLGLLGDLKTVEGNFDVAIPYLEKNLALSEELGYQKGIAKAVSTLADIYIHKQDFEKALRYFDKSIDIARKINNKLVLGFSLVEKGNALIKMKAYTKAEAIYVEALDLSEQLGNPDLIFEAKILASKVNYHKGNTKESEIALILMLQEATSTKETAALHYELSKIANPKEEHRSKALHLYRELYKASPQHLFKIRMNALEQ